MALNFSKMGILYLICFIRAILMGNKHLLGRLIGKHAIQEKDYPIISK